MTGRTTRRVFLKGGGVVVGMAGLSAVLAACSSSAPAAPTVAPAAPTSAPASTTAPAPTTAPAATQAPAATVAPAATPAAAATTAPIVAAKATGPNATALGLKLPDGAATYDQQVYRAMTTSAEPQFLERAAGVSRSGSFYPYYFSEPLVKIDEDNQLVGAIAESWNVSSDGLTWTFTIRKGLQWSDGTPLTAQDVEFTFQRIADPKVAFDWAWFFTDIKNFKEVNSGAMPMSALGVKAVDDTTFQVLMNAPAPYFPGKTLMITTSPKHILKTTDAPADWSNDPATSVACGPWKLTKWDKGKQLVFDANPNYTGVFKPFIKTIVVLVGTSDALMPAYEAGQIDAVAYEGADVTPADIAKAKSDPVAWGLHSYVDYGAYFLMFNNQMDPFTKTKLRQAISHAIDRDALAGSVGRDQSVAAYSMLPPGFPAHNDELKSVQNYDVAAAKQLLTDAGYPNGQGLGKLTISTWGPLNALRKGWIEGVQSQLKQNLNVDVDINALEIKTFYAQKAKHVYPFSFQQYQFDYFDPSNLLDLWKTGNYDYSNKDFDALIDKADHFTGSIDDRIKLYQQAEQLLVSDAGAVFLFWPQTTQFWRPYLKGKSLEPNKAGIQAFRGNKLGLTHYNMYITTDRPTITV